ncbi:MAG: thiamine-binding protein [Chloroflexi bacterium]|nr:thiamine-binding protein [Chloroflexota bacterium]
MSGISAQVSFYPLGQEDFIGPIDRFIEVVAKSGLSYQVHRMSTVVSGDDEEVFRVLRQAYAEASAGGSGAGGAAIMVITVSNVCPVVPPGPKGA